MRKNGIVKMKFSGYNVIVICQQSIRPIVNHLGFRLRNEFNHLFVVIGHVEVVLNNYHQQFFRHTASSMGSFTRKVEPSPAFDLTSILPAIKFTSSLVIDRPRPAP